MQRFSQQDHDLVTAAVTAAERDSDGEIVAIVAPRSDAYHDVALHYSVLLMLLVPIKLALLPQSWIDWWMGRLIGWNPEPTRAGTMTFVLALLILAFLIGRLIFAWPPLRMALTPRRTRRRRVRRRAIELFRSGCELRTRGRTGVLLYLSLAERRAEIVADQAIVDRVAPEAWRDAMGALVDAVKAGRPGEGMAKAVEQIGTILASVLPPSGGNPNELADRLVEL